MKKYIAKLARDLLYPAEPSPLFVESLHKYAAPAGPTEVPPLDTLLSGKSPRAYALYKRLPPQSASHRLVYVLLRLATAEPAAEEQIRAHIRRGALGFAVPFFSVSEITLLKQSCPYHVYSVIQQIFSASLKYKRLRLASSSPCSMTHKYFLDQIQPFLAEYEESVLRADLDFLVFYAQMYPAYSRLDTLCSANDLISDDNLMRSVEKYNLYCEIVASGLGTPDRSALASVLYRVHNECTHSYLLDGSFSDPYDEYFIRDHQLVPERLPPLLRRETADKIAYIGKYTCFLRGIAESGCRTGVRATTPHRSAPGHTGASAVDHQSILAGLLTGFDLSQRSVIGAIDRVLEHLNKRLYEEFIERYQIPLLLQYVKDVFFFGRVDFIEHFFSALKDSRKATRKNLLAVLESSLDDAFPGCPFNKNIDLFIKEDSSEPPHDPQYNLAVLSERFSLYCNLEYPVTVLLEEDFVLKLVYIFKFLWKLKKIDHLSRRVADPKYVNFTFSLLFYVFNEVLSGLSMGDWVSDGLALDILKADINGKIHTIMKRLFINTQAKRIEYLIFYIEKAFIAAGKSGTLDTREVQSALREFYECAAPQLENTFLFNIRSFIE